MLRKIASILAISAVLSGCSIQQTVEPTSLSRESTLCIVENSSVRKGFLNEFRRTLSVRNIDHEIVSEFKIPQYCQWTASYNAKWSWDLRLYMSYAEIEIFHQGKSDGKVLYDARKGGGNMDKFINAEDKIRELVSELIQFQSAFLQTRTYG